MKKFFFFAAALLAVISFAACSDDEEVTSNNIIGTWQIVHAQGWEIDGGEKISWSQDYPSEDYREYWTYTFDKGGTCIHTTYDMNGNFLESDYHTYSISGSTLTLYDGGEYPEIYQIKSPAESQLVLLCKGENSDGSSWELTQTYIRLE